MNVVPNQPRHDEMIDYFQGKRLYGDDFTPEQIEQWHEDEREACAIIAQERGWDGTYFFHAMNIKLGYSLLPAPPRVFEHALGFGSGTGDELLPIIPRIRKLTIIEPSETYVGSKVGGLHPEYVKPGVQGVIPFPDATFDLLTCFGVLHHIPNVSFVLRELFRVLQPGGWAIVREPVVSMGDWRFPRPGLSKHERGIPSPIFGNAIDQAGFSVVSARPCWFRPLMRVPFIARRYDSWLGATADARCSRLFAWNRTYHATKWWHKIRPACISYVLTK